jgi:murein DD-endopeptidase MepM/ murein hydrolase activator NlpD
MIDQVKTRKRNWNTFYRLVLRKEETLEEVGSYRLTLLNLYILLSSLIIVAMGLTAVVIFFTPLKRLVPGYAEPSQNPEYTQLTRKLGALEAELDSYKQYYEHFNKLISLTDSIEAPALNYTSRVTPGQPTGKTTTNSEEVPVVTEPKRALPPVSAFQLPSTAMLTTADYKYLMPPISGVISNGFDAESQHFGVDILAPQNTPVKSIWDGYVIMADWTLETGYTIGVQHNNDMISFYKHNATLLKRSGAFVRAGEAIAIIGNTGKLTTGPHLHFELWLEGKPVDPLYYIDF